jgi:hypothetical protein
MTKLADFCDVGIFEAQLRVMACRRSPADNAELAHYMSTPEFGERAERLKPRLRDAIENDKPILAHDVAADLQIPIDRAVVLLKQLGIPLDHTIIGRAE